MPSLRNKHRTLEKVTSDFSKVQHPALRGIHSHWETIRGTRPMPLRSDLSPVDIVPLLPHVLLIDVTSDPRDFRLRLVGTAIQQVTGRDMTGKMISEVFPADFYAEVHRDWSSVVDEKQPLLGSGSLWVSEKEYILWEGIVMPLSRQGEVADMLLGGLAFNSRPLP